MEKGKLFIIASPIGNLSDITLRALEVLKDVDMILSEDTRETDKILKKYEIDKPQLSYRDQNHDQIFPRLVESMEMGLDLALISDSGTPLISDPGYKLVRDFIKKGKKYLKPITRADISRELKVHESTISRAVANKSVQLPNGHIIPISMFFERNLCIRETIKEIVTEEINPLSDAKIASRLKKLGFNIARRTVAKYRAMEGILPAHMRNKNNEMINNQ